MKKTGVFQVIVFLTAGVSLMALFLSCQDDSKPGGDNIITEPVSPLEDQPGKEAVAGLFDTAKGFPENLSNSWKVWGHRNPLITHGFGADASVTVHEGRVYVYASNDSLMYSEDGKVATMTYANGIQGVRVISSADLSNWTDHGVINIARPASTNPLIDEPKIVDYNAHASWAPSVTQKVINGKRKFFMYWGNAGGNAVNPGIGVISADSPVGPWTSPMDKLLIDRETPNCGPGEPNYLFDPGVMVDDDGQGYMFFGGGPKPDNSYPQFTDA
jgi:arabinoxylan arabinofuranohydrolase